MFSRADLFRVRDALTETFHTALDEPTRRGAFDMVLKINARLLRRSVPMFSQPGWSEAHA